MPQTKADSELQPMFAGLAPFFAYALLAVVFHDNLKFYTVEIVSSYDILNFVNNRPSGS